MSCNDRLTATVALQPCPGRVTVRCKRGTLAVMAIAPLALGLIVAIGAAATAT